MNWKRLEWWLALAGVAIAAVLWQYRLRFPFDDTFISFRYAEHLASGDGLVWNIGGPPTEGFTNFLFVLLLAVSRFFTHHLLAASQAFGLASTVISGILIYNIVATLRNQYAGLLAVLFYWLTPLTWINAMSGMETSVFVLFIILAIFFTAHKRITLAFIASFLATLTRPEGAALALLIIIVSVANVRTEWKRITLRFILAFVVPTALYAVWKYSYFGSLLPNAFYVKVLSESSAHFPGLQYVRLFFTSSIILIIASLGARLRYDRVLLLSSSWAIFLLVFYLFVLPLEGLYDRFLWPVFAVLCITGAVGIFDLSHRLRRTSFAFLAAFLAVLHIVTVLESPRTRQSLQAHEDVWDASMDKIVIELKALPHFDSITLAYGDAGYVVYRSGVRHLDLFGLNDTKIAHARTRSERADVVRQEHPDLMLLPIGSDSAGHYSLVEDAYGVARDSEFVSAATIEAFPYPLLLLLDPKGKYWADLETSISRRSSEPGSGLKPPVPIQR